MCFFPVYPRFIQVLGYHICCNLEIGHLLETKGQDGTPEKSHPKPEGSGIPHNGDTETIRVEYVIEIIQRVWRRSDHHIKSQIYYDPESTPRWGLGVGTPERHR